MFFLRNKYKTYKSFIKPLVVGERCQFMKPSNIYGCTLGDNIFVGPFVKYRMMSLLVIILEFNPIHLYVH